jgi:hypothetical protein
MTPEPARRIATLITGATGARTDQPIRSQRRSGFRAAGNRARRRPSPQERHRRAG